MVGYSPATLEELLELLAVHKDATLYAGGTDLMVVKRFSENVIFIAGIEELRKIEHRDGFLVIGSCRTYDELLHSDIPEIMKEVFVQIASPAIRNRGTVGGNICNASPAGDTLPMLYALNAQVELKSPGSAGQVFCRTLPVREFILGIRRLDRRPGEVLTAVKLPEDAFSEDACFYYKKVGARRAEAISKLSFFGTAKIKDDVVENAQAAFGAVGITVVNPQSEAGLFEEITKHELAKKKNEIIDAYMEHVKPIDDQRSTAEYRKITSARLLGDFIDMVINK